MADTKLSALTELAAAPAADDEIYIRDVSEAAADESKRITALNLKSGGSAMGVHLSVSQHFPQELYNRILFDTELFDVDSEFDNSKKTGAADATEANKLHDADGGFASGDVGKTVWNTTDNTYALVSAFVDSGELTLDADIMVDTETYVLFKNIFTATYDGKYLVVVTLIWTGPADQMNMRVGIKVNTTFMGLPMSGASGTAYSVVAGLLVLDMSASDYLDFFAYHDGGATESILGGNPYQTTLFINRLS